MFSRRALLASFGLTLSTAATIATAEAATAKKKAKHTAAKVTPHVAKPKRHADLTGTAPAATTTQS